MSFASEFKAFALRGNAIDLAVGIIIGAAFGKIVTSIVEDLVMPVVGRIFGGLDFSDYFVTLSTPPPGVARSLSAMRGAGVPVLAYGNFATVALNFVLLAMIIFVMVKQLNRLKREQPPAPAAAPPEELALLREIRDALRR